MKRRKQQDNIKSMIISHNGSNLLCLTYSRKERYIAAQEKLEIIRTQLKLDARSNTESLKFIPKTPVTTAKIVTTNVAAVSSNSNWISWFRTLSCLVHKLDKIRVDSLTQPEKDK